MYVKEGDEIHCKTEEGDIPENTVLLEKNFWQMTCSYSKQ